MQTLNFYPIDLFLRKTCQASFTFNYQITFKTKHYAKQGNKIMCICHVA